MAAPGPIKLHQTPNSHPCMVVRTAMELKGLEYEVVDYPISAQRAETMEEIFGSGRRTVPGVEIGDEKIHGSRAITARLEELAPDPAPRSSCTSPARWPSPA